MFVTPFSLFVRSCVRGCALFSQTFFLHNRPSVYCVFVRIRIPTCFEPHRSLPIGQRCVKDLRSIAYCNAVPERLDFRLEQLGPRFLSEAGCGCREKSFSALPTCLQSSKRFHLANDGGSSRYVHSHWEPKNMWVRTTINIFCGNTFKRTLQL